jgi:hypothetical protein
MRLRAELMPSLDACLKGSEGSTTSCRYGSLSYVTRGKSKQCDRNTITNLAVGNLVIPATKGDEWLIRNSQSGELTFSESCETLYN